MIKKEVYTLEDCIVKRGLFKKPHKEYRLIRYQYQVSDGRLLNTKAVYCAPTMAEITRFCKENNIHI